MNIFDYAKFYKNSTFEEIPFNQMDAFVYSILVYLPIYNIEDGCKLNSIKNNIRLDEVKGAVAPIAVELYSIISNSKRYGSVKIYNLQKVEDDEVQFGAMTFRFGNNTFVSYEGTNASIVGWVENFMLTCEYPTKTQALGIEYIEETITELDKKIYVGGHSKGGNLAMCASMECRKDIFERIEKIYNFDGPGFRKEEIETDKFKNMNKKVLNVLPEGSLVGILMNNKNYNFVEAEGVGFKQHYPTSWNVFGEFFIEKKQSKHSKQIESSLEKSVEELKPEDIKKILGMFTDFLKKNNISNMNDFKTLKFEETLAMIKEIKDVDESSKKLFMQILKILINPDNGKEA